MRVAIKVEGLCKYYKEVKAVDGISFEVYEGEIFGMVGPNGAGKTTTIECLEGLRKPDGGTIRVLGLDPLKDRDLLQNEIGIQLQESILYPRIKVKEVGELFSSFYPKPLPWKDLSAKLGLQDKQNVCYEKLSGGLKKRLHIALALIGDPKIIFFDEITGGLDPQARRNMWELIKEIRAQGKTIFMTTHYMEEAQELCDRVCIIDRGKIVALDKPDKLIQSIGAETKVIFTTQKPIDLELLKGLPCVSQVKGIDNEVIVYGKGNELLINIIQIIQNQGLSLQSLQIKQPTLEDAYLALTGREYRD